MTDEANAATPAEAQKQGDRITDRETNLVLPKGQPMRNLMHAAMVRAAG
jgi:hypothetical protein